MECSQFRWLTALLPVIALTGCSGDEGRTGGPSFGTEDPVYVVSTGVESGEDFVGYLVAVPSLDAESSFDLKNGLEIEPSWIFGMPGRPYVFAASLFSATITRYELLADGSFEQRDVVDFSNLGVRSAYLAASAPVYSEEKSYFVDDAQDQIVIWNPSRMTVIGTIPMGNEEEDGLPPAPEGMIVRHGELLLTAVDWSDWMADSSTYGSHTRLVAIDPATDRIVESTDDSRLSYASPLGQASDGTLYFSPPSLIAAYSEISEGRGSPSRALRVAPSEATFEADYALDLSELVGGRPAGSFTLLDDETALVRAFHSELVDPVTPDSWEDVLWSQAGFLWWRWRIGDSKAVQIPNQTPGVLDSTLIQIDGKSYVVRTAEDSASSTLDRIGPEGGFEPGLTGPGQFIGNGVVRLR